MEAHSNGAILSPLGELLGTMPRVRPLSVITISRAQGSLTFPASVQLAVQ